MEEYAKLLEPYKANSDPNGSERTIEGQLSWLIRKGIPAHICESAMVTIYEEIARGRTFESGHHLDRAILAVAQDIQKKSVLDGLKATRKAIVDSVHGTGKLKKIWKVIAGEL